MTDGLEVMKHLGGLAMQAEANLWTSSALFGGAEGVLLLAYFGMIQVSNSELFLTWWISAIARTGLIFSIAWLGAGVLLQVRRWTWATKAKRLQTLIGIPNEFGPWGRNLSFALVSDAALFFVTWIPFMAIRLLFFW